MLFKFNAVLNIICGFLTVVLYLDPFTAMYCCHVVVSEDAKTMLASGLQTLSLERESNIVSQCVRPWIKLTPEYPFKLRPNETIEVGKNHKSGVHLILMTKVSLSFCRGN